VPGRSPGIEDRIDALDLAVAGQRTINSESLPTCTADRDEPCGAAETSAAETSAGTSSAAETSANGRRKIAMSGSPPKLQVAWMPTRSVQGVVSNDGNGLRCDQPLSAR